MSRPTIRYEDAAERATVTGWACKTCRRFYGDAPQKPGAFPCGSEHAARSCCATDLPCRCGGRNENKTYVVCEACRDKLHEDRFQNLERVAWDGDTPLAVWDGDRFFFAADDLADFCAGRNIDPTDLRLVVCRPQKPRVFEVNDWCQDELGEDQDVPNATAIDERVNAVLGEIGTLSWVPTNRVATPESVAKFVAWKPSAGGEG